MAEVIEGTIRFGVDAVAFAAATMLLLFEDTTYVDVPAILVSRVVVNNVSFDGNHRNRITFRVEFLSVPQGRVYTLRVLVDLDGDGKASPGDYVSRESIPVSGLEGSSVAIDVVRVGPRA